MARLSNDELNNKTINELETYANNHPKEGLRIATHMGKKATQIAFKTSTQRVKDGIFTATFSYKSNTCE